MQFELLCQPGGTASKVTIAPGETLVAQSGAMIAMDKDIRIETTTMARGMENQGILGKAMAVAKRMLAGESLFLNKFTTQEAASSIFISPTLPGDIMIRNFHQETLMVQGSSWLASTEGIAIDATWQGFKGFFTGENIFWIKLSGTGTAALSSFGSIYPLEVRGSAMVDTGHIVAFEETLSFKVVKAASSWMASFLGGEGFACRFEGNGTVWCQSHNPQSFGQMLGPLLTPRQA